MGGEMLSENLIFCCRIRKWGSGASLAGSYSLCADAARVRKGYSSS